ncbi:hypothetical protein B0H12DRAFT_1236350 [Mycena haematopus]|nr:hypothetical protein B0H12DRAFT_1236350 [Mycena haematopus]
MSIAFLSTSSLALSRISYAFDITLRARAPFDDQPIRTHPRVDVTLMSMPMPPFPYIYPASTAGSRSQWAAYPVTHAAPNLLIVHAPASSSETRGYLPRTHVHRHRCCVSTWLAMRRNTYAFLVIHGV